MNSGDDFKYKYANIPLPSFTMYGTLSGYNHIQLLRQRPDNMPFNGLFAHELVEQVEL